MRILHRCYTEHTLHQDVHAVVRVITTGKDRQFASNVAVNLNNQTRVDNTFLRSNDPRIVQLSHSLSSLGYFLERRAGEIEAMPEEQLEKLEDKFGTPFHSHVIPLKDGMQAYVATYYGDPQLAKKDPAKMFTDDGGSFSKILQSDLTAEKFRDAYRLSRLVSAQVDLFKRLKRKRYSDQNERKMVYITKLGTFMEPVFPELDIAIPQISIFGMALLFEKSKITAVSDFNEFVEKLSMDPTPIWRGFSELISARNVLGSDMSWPTLLKSGTFFKEAVAHLKIDWSS